MKRAKITTDLKRLTQRLLSREQAVGQGEMIVLVQLLLGRLRLVCEIVQTVQV